MSKNENWFYKLIELIKRHKITSAVIVAVTAAILVSAIAITSILYVPANADPIYSSKNDVISDTVSLPQDILSSEEAVFSEPEIVTSSEVTVSSEAPTASAPAIPDTTTITPMKSRHAVPEGSESFDITLSFAGDMILATNNYGTAGFNSYAATQPPTYFLEKVRHIFEADDFTIVNLENVLTDRALTPVYKNYTPAFWFGSKASNIEILSTAAVEGAALSNNHTHDYGNDGYIDTVQTVRNAGLLHGDASNTMYFEKNGFVVAVICSGMWGEYQANTIVNLIKAAEQHSHYQVVLYHGGTEKIHAPEEWKKRAARKLVDNGADLVVGGHPHVLQPREIYNGVEIIYSIGNFCYGGHRQPENRTVIYQMTLTVGNDLMLQASNSNIIPCYVYTAVSGGYQNYQPAVVDDETIKNRILDFMDGKISSPV